jgi:hypothetical protein
MMTRIEARQLNFALGGAGGLGTGHPGFSAQEFENPIGCLRDAAGAER